MSRLGALGYASSLLAFQPLLVRVAPVVGGGGYGIADKRDFFSVSLGPLTFWGRFARTTSDVL
jgi:hypothetical protein